MVDMGKAIIVKAMKNSDDTADVIRKIALHNKQHVVAMGSHNERTFPVLECTPHGDIQEVLAPRLRTSIRTIMAEKYFEAAVAVEEKTNLRTLGAKYNMVVTQDQNDRRFEAFKVLGAMVEASAAILKAEGSDRNAA
jgi:hypothetical protein